MKIKYVPNMYQIVGSDGMYSEIFNEIWLDSKIKGTKYEKLTLDHELEHAKVAEKFNFLTLTAK